MRVVSARTLAPIGVAQGDAAAGDVQLALGDVVARGLEALEVAQHGPRRLVDLGRGECPWRSLALEKGTAMPLMGAAKMSLGETPLV